MFMDTQEVVVVTINYRLSALGWLVLKEEGVEGNHVFFHLKYEGKHIILVPMIPLIEQIISHGVQQM